MHYQPLLINDGLRTVLAELENHLVIHFNWTAVEQVFEDEKNDQVSFKLYLFYKEKSFFSSDWEISGAVNEYEPETLFLKSEGGFGKKKKFDDFFEQHV
ncbi:MAG TPA: hypothetical protein VF690_13760 [Hymenobacter sp.]|jgi:hypothetical protein